MGKREAARQARSDVLWCLGGFCLLQVGLVVAMEHWRPEYRDLEYGCKRSLLRQRLEENPGRPLALVLGSSRVLNGFRPEVLPPCPTPDGAAVVFNFGQTGHGPLHQLLTLRRLLADGHRPRWLFVEVLPALLPLEYTGEELIKVERQGWGDLPALRRYFVDPRRLYSRWLEARVVPCFSCRFCLLNCFWPSLVPPAKQSMDVWSMVDASGWLKISPAETPADQAHGVELAREQHAPVLGQFHIAGVPDRALREMLELCRQEHIEAALLLMPEGKTFRGWYPPAARIQLDAYLAELRREYGIPVVDAGEWVPDEDFRDSHHLLPEGAALFTRRFGREALQPFLAGQPLPARPTLAARHR